MMRKLGLFAFVPCTASLDAQGAGGFVTGFTEGLLGKTEEVEQCGKNLHKVAKAGVHLVQDLGKRNVSEIVGDIEELLIAFQSSLGDCKGAAVELKPFLRVLDGVHSPGDLYQKIKTNGLDNDEAIVAAFEGAGKYCTFREPNGKKCGLSLGRPVRFLLLGDAVQLQLESQGASAFLAGFAEGLIGDADGVEHCAKDLSVVAGAGMSLAKDALNKDVDKTVVDLQHLLLAFQDSIGDCKDAVGELKPFLKVLDGVHSPGDLYQKLKKNALAGDESIVDAFEGAGKYCTFREPNGKKCGMSLGHPMRVLLLGPDNSLELQLDVQGPGAFFGGFAEGLLGDAVGVKHCGKDLGKVAAAGVDLAQHLGKFNVSRTVGDIQKILVAFEASIGDCKSAAGALKPFLSILQGVHSPSDLYKKLKKNGLDNDEAIIDAFEGAGKYCTFAEPDGRKCGKSLGRPIRLILIGKASEALVLV